MRIAAIIFEVALLALIAFAMLRGAGLAIYDLNLPARYRKAVALGLVAVGVVSVVFFISHLTAFYPG